MVNQKRKPNTTKLQLEEEEHEIPEMSNEEKKRQKLKEEEEKEEVEQPEEAKACGKPFRVSGQGRQRKRHYKAFEVYGNRYELGDSVLIAPQDIKQKPYVAIIKGITKNRNGNMTITGQWFYRPEEAKRKEGGSWPSCNSQELFYSFHRDDVPAGSVMHKCVVHFVPVHKQLPIRKKHPGFIVQKVYDTVEQKLLELSDKDFKNKQQHEIDILVQKTMSRLRDLPDIEIESTV